MKNMRCSICTHPQRNAIEAVLIAGQSLRTTARQFANTSKDALHRHLDHVDHALRAEVAERADLTASSIAGRLAESADDARLARRSLLAAGRYREAARLADVEARALGTLADRLGVSDLGQVEQAKQLAALQAAVSVVLVNAPDHAPAIVAEVRRRGHDDLAAALQTAIDRALTYNPKEIEP